jgi:plasmid maintenance system antidote protein VapI
MDSAELQQQIFQQIKTKLPQHLSMVDEVANVLNVSTDSAYRRIRGEKALSLEEVYKLCVHFQISFDQLFNLQSGTFMFKGEFAQDFNFDFHRYVSNIEQQVKYMNSFQQKQMFYVCKDIPVFHHFHFREIAAFKYFLWMKLFIQSPEFAHKKFRLADYPNEMWETGKKILKHYNHLESSEIWNIESVNSTIRQIEFYRDMDMLADEEEVYQVYDALERLVTHLELQADAGHKFFADDPAHTPMGSFQMYFNEVTLGDNCIMAVLDGTKAVFINHSVINFMLTRDTHFCDRIQEHIQNLMRKSTLISQVSERERTRFFKHLRQRIVTRKQALKHSPNP